MVNAIMMSARSFGVEGRGPIQLGEQPGNQPGHGVHMSAVQLGIGLRECFIAAGLQLKLRRKQTEVEIRDTVNFRVADQ